MIICRSPLRISLGGGGTDLPSYYQDATGFVIAAAIDKYVYVTVNRPFVEGIFLKYSKLEKVNDVDSIIHPIIRESLREMNLRTPQIEITSIADIPAGTGLGSSGSFTTALLKALHVHYQGNIQPDELAELACKIELDKLAEPIGKQDQYIAAFGGIRTFRFEKNGEVETKTLPVSKETLNELEDNLLLFFTGVSRSASGILKDQDVRSKQRDEQVIQNLNEIKRIGFDVEKALVQGDLSVFGELMNEHWMLKKSRSKGMSSDPIDEVYKSSLSNGATGGKLVGAGGGGFLMFYAHDREKLRKMMKSHGFPEVRFKFDHEGTRVVLS
jgi:D-glycero-alpha-D-manno-heptose-7-phosphate kinase